MIEKAGVGFEKKTSTCITAYSVSTGSVNLLAECLRYLTAVVWPPDERLLEYGVLETVFDEVTPYQHVQVVRTRDFGKILVLDGFHSEWLDAVCVHFRSRCLLFSAGMTSKC